MRKINFFYALLFISSISLNAQTLTVAKAINMAGKQRMLVNKMAKSYMALGGNIRAEEAAKDLDDVTATFNESQRELTNFAKTKETKEAIAYANSIWNDFRMKLTSEPNIINAESVILESRILTNACNTVVEKLQTENITALASPLVNNCGKQRMNLQRLSMLFMAKSWGVNYANLDRDLKETIAAVESNLYNLTSAKDNTPDINTALAFQKSEWGFLKNTFNSEIVKASNIYSSTNVMTKEFDNITAMYTKLAEEGKLAAK